MKTNLLNSAYLDNAEWALENQKRFQAVFEYALDAMLVADEHMCFVDANPAACALVGYSCEELLRLKVPDITPLANQGLLGTLWQVLNSAGKLEGEYELLRKDGNIIVVEFRAVANIIPGLYFAILHDISARKLAEESMRKAQARTESILASIGDTYIVFNREWQYTYVNEAAIRAIGWPREQILGRTLWELYPDIVGTELDCQCHRAMEERVPATFDFYYATRETWWENRFYPVTQGLAVFATDITERKQAEGLRAQLAAIVDCSHDAIFSKSLDGIILSWNKGAQRLYGYSPEEAIGQPVSLIFPSNGGNEAREIMERIRRGELIQHHETKRIKKDGTAVDVSVTISPIRDASGRIVGASSIGRDISERKQMEEQQQLLYKRVQMREKQLRELASYLQTTREEERTRLARQIHDELGQALTALKMDLSWLTKRIPLKQPAVRDKFNAMAELIDQTVIRVRQIATELRPGLLDHLGLVAAIEWQTQEFSDRTGIVCELEILEKDMVFEDEVATQLFRIFQEALTNIARHAEASRVRIKMVNERGDIILRVEDNGRGIQRAKLTSSTSLGLLGMRERTWAMGGQFKIRGNKDKGTYVEVRIPR